MRTTTILAAVAVAVLALGLAGCGSSSPTSTSGLPPMGGLPDGSLTAAAATPLLGTWRLVSLEPAGQPAEAAPAGTVFTTEFRPEGVVSSTADCNRCLGGYTADKGTLAVGTMACTMAYCVKSAPFDTTFARMLGGAQSWEVAGATLRLRGEPGAMTFVR